MPFLRIQTNATIEATRLEPLLKKASQLAARELGKPEQYMMVGCETVRAMLFAGSSQPAAFLELKSIGLPAGKTAVLSDQLCELVGSELGVPRDRIYLNFADVPASHWGWNGETF